MGILGFSFVATLPFEPGYQVYKDGVKITPPNWAAYEWWPNCRGDSAEAGGPTALVTNCGTTCCNCVLRDAFRNYTSHAAFLEVKFPSRSGDDNQEVVELVGWWLPAHPQRDSGAAVVLQHGLGGSINDFRPALAAYLLRTAGFSVLLPNLRGHGASQAPRHGRMSWGYDYPFDILGAWDYVVGDPDRVLGGPRDAGKVGLMGLSLGGFVAATAFGLEGRVPALWLDGAVSDPKDVIAGQMERLLPWIGHLCSALTKEPGWALTELFAGLRLRHHSPAEALPTGPRTRRPAHLVHNGRDMDVPAFMAERYRRIFQTHADKYDFTLADDLAQACETDHGEKVQYHTNGMLPWIWPDEYRRRLCRFWGDALLQQPCDELQFVPRAYS